MSVLAFDIGIKNLAFAVLDASKNCIALENYDLLSDLKVAATPCTSCKSNASYQSAPSASAMSPSPIPFTRISRP